MSLNFGSIRIDETFFPISSITPRTGGLIIKCSAMGPISACSGHWRWFSAEGEPVTDSASGETSFVKIPAIGPYDSFLLTLNLNFYRFDSDKPFILRDLRPQR